MKKKDNKTAEKAAPAESKPAAVALLLKGVEGGTKNRGENKDQKESTRIPNSLKKNYFGGISFVFVGP